ncbi:MULTISPECIES: Gfo/Idh/MocA family protein [Paenibacillus]|uniref:Gfo/Idh/MocA family protein n=1 Tax=Paenibacillus TaxID=44249 RepID=UPI0022B8763D|nr:Gfo/Idh/MocA family oxidoreductase [Paenibacillus caseinilyticus]MCZ8522064.1 Gfo/Idh/MocA family oxidoreductase [Paenibacillus caseinilyticus]
MGSKVRWGILGYARIAKTSVIPGILKSENAELYAIASGDEEKRQEVRDTYAGTKVYEGYEQLLDDPQVQAVYIPLPNSMHKEWAIAAMNRGKHVLCEKPIALNSAECGEMIEAAENNGVYLMEAFMYRYTDRVRKLQELVRSGEIGEIRYIHSAFRFLLNRPGTIKMQPGLGGGSLYDVGSYPVNFIGMITGETPESCVSQSVLENGVDVLFSAVLKYKSGIVATINSGFNAFGQMNSEIVGTKGRIEIPDTFLGTAGKITVVTEEGSRQIDVAESDRYTLEVADFSAAVLEGRPPLFPLEETRRNMQVLDMLLASVKPV